MIDKKDYSIEIIDDIMFYTCKCKILSKEIVLEGIKDRISLSNNEDQYIVSDMLSVGYWPSSARDELGKKEHQILVKCAAVIIKSNLIATLLNWFLIFFGIEIPTKIFPDKKPALEWITVQKLKDQKTELKETS